MGSSILQRALDCPSSSSSDSSCTNDCSILTFRVVSVFDSVFPISSRARIYTRSLNQPLRSAVIVTAMSGKAYKEKGQNREDQNIQ